MADAINEYNSHPSIEKIKLYYENDIKNFDFQTVDAHTVMLMIKNIDSKKATGYDNIPGKLIKVAHRELATPPLQFDKSFNEIEMLSIHFEICWSNTDI